jgi:hypothetical protein
MILKRGKLRADKVQYRDGVGCCVWYPFPGDDEEGTCFDFSASDIDDFIALLQDLNAAEPDRCEE